MAVLTQDRLSLPVIQRRKDGVEELRLEGFLVLLFFSAFFFKAEFSYGLLGTFFGEMEKCGLTAKRFFFQLVEDEIKCRAERITAAGTCTVNATVRSFCTEYQSDL